MSVLTVTGTTFPDPTLAFDYTRSSSVRASLLPTGPAFAAPAARHSYSRAEKKSYTVTTQEIHPTSSPNNHQHSRTISSSTLPADPFNPAGLKKALPFPIEPRNSSHRRQSSNSTNNMSMHRQGTTTSTSSVLPRRSTSGRSIATNAPTSYVALMRKQKATVWCDRSQSTDPRIAAAQKAARMRAHLEVSATSTASGARTSTISSGGVVGKIRHGGVPKAPGYVPANMSGAGVPMRLSANEMLGDEEENITPSGENSMVHGRSSSGKSSTNSAKYRSGYPRPDPQGRFSSTSNASTPPSGAESGSPSGRDRIPEETPTNAHDQDEYFMTKEKRSMSSNDEDGFGELKDLSGPSSVQNAMAKGKTVDDLRRRGSVDERAMSMGTGVKLFVANPDLNDD